MKQYVIWLILLHLCCCENLDYSDFYPEHVPLEAENPSPEYKEVMKNLCDNWHSPISYLKKRGYMPNNIEYDNKVNPKKKMYHKNIEKGENYFFFPENKEQRSRNSIMSFENDDNNEQLNTEDILKTEPQVTELPTIKQPKNDTIGIINKVKDKFLSIFSNKNKTDQIEESFDLEDPEFLENYNDDEYAISDRRIFARSVSEKGRKNLNSSTEGILSNLTDSEIRFIKSFINWFKQNKDDLNLLSSSILNTTAFEKNSNVKNDESKLSLPKTQETRPNEIKPKAQNSTESGVDNKVSSTMKPLNGTSECSVVGSESSTTDKPVQGQSTSAVSKNITLSTTGGKDTSNDFTVDLDINQKNGTGQEVRQKTICPCIQTSLTTSTFSPAQSCSDRSKYITKSKFLAHLHHMVDEVGKPPHKPLDLAKVQDIIDKSKHMSTVTMGGDKTTQCAPLQLNDMSFDLEWSKLNTVPHNSRENMNILDLPNENQPEGESMAAKFLRDVSSYPGNNDEYLEPPYTDNFLDSQQYLPNDLELPLKSSTKREVALPSFGNKFDDYLLPDTEIVDENYLPYFENSPKRRIKGRIKGRSKQKRPKHKNNIPAETPETTIDFNVGTREGTNFDSFDELKDIQFRVNDNDEQAISTFISNLNSPPEVFSFDVDKYLRSAKQNMEPKSPEFEYQSPEQRTFYEFLESPAVENERLPLIEAPVVEKRSRTSTEKRDLLRQYIKGVSSALNNFHDIYSENYNKDPLDKLQRSPSLQDTDISIRTNNLIDRFSTNLDAMNNIKSNGNDDSVNNYFLLNDDSAAFDVPKQEPEVVPNDYSPQSLEIDLDLDKKFRDLNIGRYNNDISSLLIRKNVEKTPEEASDL